MNTQILLADISLEWWNLIFILPFGLGLLYLGIYTLSGWTFGEADADMHFDHDIDAHLDAEGHVALEHDVDADADAHDAESSAGHGSSLMTALSWLGVGRVPLSLVLMVYLLSWGTLGFSANQLLASKPLAQSLPVSLAIAAVGSVFIVRVVAMTVGKFLPTTETYARRRHELLGSVGEALYPIDQTFGMVCGRDDRGERFEVACRTSPSQPPIPKGQKIQLVAYMAKERMFYVAPAQAEPIR